MQRRRLVLHTAAMAAIAALPVMVAPAVRKRGEISGLVWQDEFGREYLRLSQASSRWGYNASVGPWSVGMQWHYVQKVEHWVISHGEAGVEFFVDSQLVPFEQAVFDSRFHHAYSIGQAMKHHHLQRREPAAHSQVPQVIEQAQHALGGLYPQGEIFDIIAFPNHRRAVDFDDCIGVAKLSDQSLTALFARL